MEIGKPEKLMDKENLNQNRRDDRSGIGRKNEIFKHGIQGIKKITGQYKLTEVKSAARAVSSGHGKNKPPA